MHIVLILVTEKTEVSLKKALFFKNNILKKIDIYIATFKEIIEIVMITIYFYSYFHMKRPFCKIKEDLDLSKLPMLGRIRNSDVCQYNCTG